MLQTIDGAQAPQGARHALLPILAAAEPAWAEASRECDATLQAWHKAQRAAAALVAWPFDLVRSQYGLAVQLGLARRSMLDGREVERLLAHWELATLGALARRV